MNSDNAYNKKLTEKLDDYFKQHHDGESLENIKTKLTEIFEKFSEDVFPLVNITVSNNNLSFGINDKSFYINSIAKKIYDKQQEKDNPTNKKTNSNESIAEKAKSFTFSPKELIGLNYESIRALCKSKALKSGFTEEELKTVCTDPNFVSNQFIDYFQMKTGSTWLDSLTLLMSYSVRFSPKTKSVLPRNTVLQIINDTSISEKMRFDMIIYGIAEKEEYGQAISSLKEMGLYIDIPIDQAKKIAFGKIQNEDENSKEQNGEPESEKISELENDEISEPESDKPEKDEQNSEDENIPDEVRENMEKYGITNIEDYEDAMNQIKEMGILENSLSKNNPTE